MTIRVSAPGKLMVAGEYVVLQGAEALVAAVNARLRVIAHRHSPGDNDRSSVHGADSPDSGALPPEAELARRYAEDVLGETAIRMELDRSALNRDGRKLGLGSSSAAAAATVGAVMAWHGRDPAQHRAQVFEWALKGHRAIAPEGSGADVAAATLGGVVRYRRADPAAARPVRWPSELIAQVVWTGHPARTSELVAKVNALAQSKPAVHEAASAPLRAAAAALIAALERADLSTVIGAADAHGLAMGELGRAAGAPIITDRLAQTADLARACGGGAKPSGAGGGDVALAFFGAPADAARFGAACAEAGLTLLDLRIGEEGVRSDVAPDFVEPAT